MQRSGQAATETEFERTERKAEGLGGHETLASTSNTRKSQPITQLSNFRQGSDQSCTWSQHPGEFSPRKMKSPFEGSYGNYVSQYNAYSEIQPEKEDKPLQMHTPAMLCSSKYLALPPSPAFQDPATGSPASQVSVDFWDLSCSKVSGSPALN